MFQRPAPKKRGSVRFFTYFYVIHYNKMNLANSILEVLKYA